ncbi:hypothetical protein EDD11_001457 [Mortierella claussenii]|nr:hypothetical protein EDD11_001457 [Mortierella claussenii]
MTNPLHDNQTPGQVDPKPTGNGNLNFVLRVRKRDKVRTLLGLNKSKPNTTVKANTIPEAARLDVTTLQAKDMLPSQANIVVSNIPKNMPSTTAKVARVRMDIFPVNVAKPKITVELSSLKGRIEKTSQLFNLCNSLLSKDTSVSTPSDEDAGLSNRTAVDSQDSNFHERQKEFINDPTKDSAAITEVVFLAPILDYGLYRTLLNCIIAEFKKSDILDPDLVQGLIQMLQCASPGYLQSDNLVKILNILRAFLEGTHPPSTEHLFHLTLAVSQLLDVMADDKVEGLNRTLEREPLFAILSGMKDHSDPYLMYQASYAFQALQYVRDGETPLKAVLRYSIGAAESLINITSVIQLDFGGFLEGLKSMQEALEKTYGIAKSGYEGARSLIDSGRGLFDSLKDGFSSGHKHPWYPALRVADNFVRRGQLADLNQWICEAPCRRDPFFQWGICDLLGKLAVDPVWSDSTRQQAIDLLGDLYTKDSDWEDTSVKSWMLNILAQLGKTSDRAIMVHAQILLDNLKANGGSAMPCSYPLRARFPIPTSSPILARVQNIPYVEYELRKLQLQRIEESSQTIYIRPQAKANLQAKDDDLFPLMKNVEEFLASDRQVMLILGDSGAGKSTFNRRLEYELWRKYAKGGRIPLFISLPDIHEPNDDMVGKQLRELILFSDLQIKELMQHREFILICDGYDESRLLVNLHYTNKLNQHGRQLGAKMVISCRTQYLGVTYIDLFRPLPSNRCNPSSVDLFQQAVIAPFSRDQIERYIDQYLQDPSTRSLFGDRPMWATKDYMDRLVAIPKLMDLVTNPFLLNLVLRTLPKLVEAKHNLSDIHITRVGLYDSFVEQWLEHERRRLCSGLNSGTLTYTDLAAFKQLCDDDFVLNGIDYLKRLSTWIFKEEDGINAVHYSHLLHESTWKAKFFSDEPKIQLLRVSSPLTRNRDQFRFIHQSVLEYFYSRTVYEPNRTATTTTTLDSTSAPLSAANHPLSLKNLNSEPSILQFLAERVQLEPVFKNELRSFIERSKTDKKWSVAAANAITILVRAGVRFNGADLRSIQIPGADLSEGEFDSTQLQGADLSNTILRNIWLRQANLSSAQMAGVKFGEWPYLEEDDGRSYNSGVFAKRPTDRLGK